MFRRLATTCLLLLFSSPVALRADDSNGKDLLRFVNGDFIHGTFSGINRSSRLSWSRPDLDQPATLETSKISRIIFNEGTAPAQSSDPATIELASGDILPCEILSLSEKELRINTSYAGELIIPREAVTRLSPSPWGGHLVYRGPFVKKGWTPLSPLPEESTEPTPRSTETKTTPGWIFSSAAWTNTSFEPLRADFDLPASVRIQFDLAWKQRLQFGIALHSDFQQPPEDAESPWENPHEIAENARYDRLPLQLGTGLVCSFHGSTIQLDATGFDAERQPARVRIASENQNFRREFAQTGKASFDIRTDRLRRKIMIYINDELVMNWEGKHDDFFAPGSGLALMTLNQTSRIRLSNVTITDWHGEPDSVLSMRPTGTDDIILLTNGTDRFAGRVSGISDEIVQFKNAYAELSIPKRDVSTISLASKTKTESLQELPTLHLQPAGYLRGSIRFTQDKRLHLTHSLLGEIDLSIPHLSSIEFLEDAAPLSHWGDDF